MKLKAFAVGIATILTLVGCQGSDMDKEGSQADRNTIERTGYEDGTGNPDMKRNMEDRGNRNVANGRNMRDQKNTGKNRNMTNTQNIDNNKDEYGVSEEAADKITEEIAEIDSAYVLTTANNAYVAAMMGNDNNQGNTNNKKNTNKNNEGKNRSNNMTDQGDEVSDEIKKKISDIVQSVDSNIDHVYVTTNPDFTDLTNNYMNDMNDGKPIGGFFDQIGNMIERVFPQDKRK